MNETQPAHKAGGLQTSTCGQESQGGESISDQLHIQILTIFKYQGRKDLIHNNKTWKESSETLVKYIKVCRRQMAIILLKLIHKVNVIQCASRLSLTEPVFKFKCNHKFVKISRKN